jgi:hypothetical protein
MMVRCCVSRASPAMLHTISPFSGILKYSIHGLVTPGYPLTEISACSLLMCPRMSSSSLATRDACAAACCSASLRASSCSPREAASRVAWAWAGGGTQGNTADEKVACETGGESCGQAGQLLALATQHPVPCLVNRGHAPHLTYLCHSELLHC